MVLSIKDLTDENSHPDLIDLQAFGPEIPEGYEIVSSNLFTSPSKDEGVVKYIYDNKRTWWTWVGPPGFDGGYETPESCLHALLEYLGDIDD